MNSHNAYCVVRRALRRDWAHAASNSPEVIDAKKPVDSHCARGRPMANSSMIAGSATKIVVVDSTMAMVPTISTASIQWG